MINLPDLTRLKENIKLQFIALLGCVFLFVGKPVPFGNEYSYLLHLKQVYDPGFIRNDITFSTLTNEYWLFDHLFGLLTFFFSIGTVGWIGRLTCWSVLIFALMKLGKRWKIPIWMISVAIFVWLFAGQSIIADEWMLGGFEAKCAAYICLIFALDLACDEKDISSAVLLGLSFAFHPVIGLWGIGAAMPAFLFWHRDAVRTIKIAIICGAISLIGLIPLLQLRLASVLPTTENLKYFELIKFPYHFDPFSWPKSSILLLGFLLVFCLAVHYQVKDTKPPKFLILFLTILGVFFASGILLRVLDNYELMKYTPTRLFAVFIPLFFLFYLGKALGYGLLRKPVFIALVVAIMSFAFWNKVPSVGIEQVRSTYEYWQQTPDETAEAFSWLKQNTSNETLVIAPPWRYDFWYLSERAEIVNYRKPIINAVGEWQRRLDKLTGNANPEDGAREDEDMAKFYFQIGQETMDSLAAEYGAEYLVSETDYSYPTVYINGRVKIFRLR